MGASIASGFTALPPGFPKPNNIQTLVNISFTNGSNAAVIYTVPAGKKLYVMGIMMSPKVTAGYLGLDLSNGSIGAGSLTNAAWVVSANIPIVTGAHGTNVTISCQLNGCTGCFWGWVE